MTSLKMATPKQNENNFSATQPNNPTLPTFLDHVHELQSRLFAIALTFILIAAAAYPFFDSLAAIIIAPLDDSQELVYLTPGGAFSFIIQVCMYFGALGALPVIVFHLYRFLMPAVRQVYLRTVLGYTLASLVLAGCGVAFAYIVSLPAALNFLTNFNLYHINPMLTIDSYFSFVMTYLLAGALLFQLPLIMIIINSVKPLTPSKMMGAQRAIIVGSFIVAAIISPTPDALNQTLLASPIIVMYQLGLVLVWSVNRRKAKRLKKSSVQAIDIEPVSVSRAPTQTSQQLPKPQLISPAKQSINTLAAKQTIQQRRSLDGFVPARTSTTPHNQPLNARLGTARTVNYQRNFSNQSRHTNIDGVFKKSLV